MRGTVAPGALELQQTWPAGLRLSRSLAFRRAGDIAAQAFELLALMGVTAYWGMQAEAVRVDAARLLRVGRPGWGRFTDSVLFARRVAPTQCDRCRRPPAMA